MTRAERQRRRKALTDELLREHRKTLRAGMPMKDERVTHRIKSFEFGLGMQVQAARSGATQGRVVERKRMFYRNNGVILEHHIYLVMWNDGDSSYGTELQLELSDDLPF